MVYIICGTHWLFMLAAIITLVDAKQSFVRRCPYVPPDWPAIGHPHPNDGRGLNQLGIDFANAGNRWTKSFCMLDSDGDGRTNGEESGDFECTWKEGDPTPVVPYALSNAGVPDVFSAEDDALFQNRFIHKYGTSSPTTILQSKTASPTTTLSPTPAVTQMTHSPSGGAMPSNGLTIEPWLVAHVVLGALSLGLLFPIATGMTTICRRRLGSDWKDGHVWLSIVASIMFFISFVLPLAIIDADDIPGVITSSHGVAAILLFLCIMLGQVLTGVLLFWCRMRGPSWYAHSIVANFLVSLLGMIVLLTGYDLLEDRLDEYKMMAEVTTVEVLGSLHVTGYVFFWVGHFFFTIRKRFKTFVRLAETHGSVFRSSSKGNRGIAESRLNDSIVMDSFLQSESLDRTRDGGPKYAAVDLEVNDQQSVMQQQQLGMFSIEGSSQSLTQI